MIILGGGDYEARDASIARSAFAVRASRFRIQVSFLPVYAYHEGYMKISIELNYATFLER